MIKTLKKLVFSEKPVPITNFALAVQELKDSMQSLSELADSLKHNTRLKQSILIDMTPHPHENQKV